MKNNSIKQIAVISSFCIFAFFFVISFCSADTGNAEKWNGISFDGGEIVANVNVYNVDIAKKSNNSFIISFDIANESNVVESGVKYSTELSSANEDEDGIHSVLIDSFVYDEILSLNPNETIHKEVEYTLQNSLNGEYYLGIGSRKESGLPLSFNLGKKIVINSSIDGVEIIPETCKLFVNDEIEGYHLIVGVDINKAETLKLSCDLVNNNSQVISFTPGFKTLENTRYGAVVDNKNLSEEKLEAGERKNFIFEIPHSQISQSYTVEFSLYNSLQNLISNRIFAHYVIQGDSGNVKNLQLDKDYYKKGEEINVSLLFSGRVDYFPGSRSIGEEKPEISNLSYTVLVKNNRNNVCAQKENVNFNSEDMAGIMDVTLKSSIDCLNPVATVVLYNDKGEMLDSKNFAIESKSNTENNLQINNILISFGVIILLFILFYFFFKHEKKGANLLLVLMIFAGLGLISPAKTEALTVSMATTWPGVVSYATYSLSQNSFTTSGSHTTNISISNDINICSNGGTFTMDSSSSAVSSASLSNTCASSCDSSTTRSLTVSGSVGTHYVNVSSHLYKPNPSSSFHAGTYGSGSIPYTVTQSPYCGDSSCNNGETCSSCSTDCGICIVCGNSVVQTGETCDDGNTVSGDGCSSTCLLEVSCGNGMCEAGETAESCCSDCCGSGGCGDLVCSSGETSGNCYIDCPPSCSNGVCEPGENSVICPSDCPPFCGNIICEAGENLSNCPIDCSVCPDGYCTTESGENEATCSDDCTATCGNGLCGLGEDVSCSEDCGPVCGDGVCETNKDENFLNCHTDCLIDFREI